MKKIIIAVVLVVGVLTAFLAFRPEEKEEVFYETFEVRKGDVLNTITATGTIEPITQVEVGTQVSGTIAHVYADYNSVVKKGELIAQLDRTVLEAEYEAQVATFKSNENEYGYQKKNYERLSGLYTKKLISDSEHETAHYQHERAGRALDKSRSDLLKAKTNLNYSMIYSPIDGVVLSCDVEEGQTVAAMFNTPKLFTIANDLRKMQVIADIDEADIGQVSEGQKVMFTVDAFPDDEFEGSVTQVRLEPAITSNVVTYEVVIDAPNPDLKLKPGLTANITVLTNEEKDVLIIPLRALRFEPEEKDLTGEKGATGMPAAGQKAIWIHTPTGLACKNIRTGISDGIYVEVTDGVKAGDQIVTGLQQESKTPGVKKKKGGNPLMPNLNAPK